MLHKPLICRYPFYYHASYGFWPLWGGAKGEQ
jgi:hypothetical protein